MLKLTGAVILLFGAWGFAYSICREQKKQLFLLKDMREMYRLLQSEICYTALPLPEIFKTVSGKLKSPFGEALLSVSESMNMENGEPFAEIWEKEMTDKLMESPLTRTQKRLLFRFPECMGMNESRGQAKILDRYIEELDRMILQLEEEEKSKNKVIMSLGIAAGLLMVIILL
ncbi:MAG: stage III sporulation protein AB [Suilimivivens sp.]